MTLRAGSTREAVLAAIARLQRADSATHARSLVRQLAPLVGTMDAEQRKKLSDALERWGLDPSGARAPLTLRAGETWLLLHAGADSGHVARLVAHAYGSSCGAPETWRIRSGELGTVLHGLGALASRACRELPACLAEEAILEVAGGLSAFAVSGRSLELPAAIALLSRALGIAPTATCAASACVRPDGSLDPVAHLDEKLAALHRAYPDVQTVVVAEAQEVSDDIPPGLTVYRARTLEEALPHFGLDLEDLPSSPVEDHFARAQSLRTANTHAHSPEQWRRLSREAWESCIALAQHDPAESARCRAWAVLFAVHAGDPATANGLTRGQDASIFAEHPAIEVWNGVTHATACIDDDTLDAAEVHARKALAASERLGARDRAALRGQALGTCGRVLMHAARLTEAEPLLREAVEHHREHDSKEQARSMSYVATCLRHAGRNEEALRLVDEAHAINAHYIPSWRAAQTTEQYLALERGRILIELGAYDEAERVLLSVTPRAEIGSYPRLGAERSLVRLHLRAGREARAIETAERCLIAGRKHAVRGSEVLARVACVGTLEALTHDLRLATEGRESVVQLCEQAFKRRLTPDVIAKLLAEWIY